MILKFEPFIEEISESKKAKKGKKPLKFYTIFQTLPKSVDYRIVEFMEKNWGEYYYKSPWSFSYYSDKVGWTYKPDKSYRLASHWNFRTKRGDRSIIHCQTSNYVGPDNQYWSLGQFDEKTQKYTILLTLPYVDTKYNRTKLNEIKNKVREEYLEENKDRIKKKKEILIKKFSFISGNKENIDFYVNNDKVKLLDWGAHKIKILQNGEEKNIKFSNLKDISYKGYYKGKLVIDKPLGVKRFTIFLP